MTRRPLRVGLSVILTLAALCGLGCSSDKPSSRPSGPSGRVPLAEQPLPPATTPEVAFENFKKAADFEAVRGTLAEESRKRWEELPQWVERCAQADWELDQQLDKVFADSTDPRGLARADLYSDLTMMRADPYSDVNVKKTHVFMGGRFSLALLRAKVISDSEVELITGWASTPPDQPAPPEHIFRAIKEKDEWKLMPPARFDPTANMELLKRYTSAKGALIADVKAGKFKNRQEVLSAFSKALRRGEATPGTPEEVIEIYEATLLTGDVEGILALLARASHEKMVQMLERGRRYHDSHKAYYEALEERFANQPGEETHARHFLGKSFDGSNWVAYGIARFEILEKDMKGEQGCAFTIRKVTQCGTFVLTDEKTWILRKESEGWRIELPSDDPRFTHFAEEGSVKLIAVNEALTPRLKAGEFKSIEELQAAQRQEWEKQESRPTELPEKK